MLFDTLFTGNESILVDHTPDSSIRPEAKTKSKKELLGDAALDSPSKPKHENKSNKAKKDLPDVSPKLKKKRNKSREIEEDSGDCTLKSKKKHEVEDDIKDRSHKTSSEEEGKKKRKKKRKCEDAGRDQSKPSNGAGVMSGEEEVSKGVALPTKLHKKRKKERKHQAEELASSQDSPIQVSPVALAIEQISGDIQGNRKRKSGSHLMDSMDVDGHAQSHKKRRRDAESNVAEKKTSKKHKHRKNQAC